MSQIKVLQFISPSGFYGAERWVLAFANNIDPQRMRCDLAVTRESPNQDLRVADFHPDSAGQVHYIDMAGRFDIRSVKTLVNIIRERKIDVILTHGYKSDILGLIAGRIAGIRCVSTPHGFSGNVGFKLKMFIRLGTSILRYFDAVAPLSEELVEDMLRFRVPSPKIRFIRNGVDIKDIDATLSNTSFREKSEAGIRPIGFIGQLIPRKGLLDLLSAFEWLHGHRQGLELQLIGEGRQRPELEEKCTRMKAGPAVRFLGFREDRLELLSKFEMFVMTSSLEGIPRCLMEAMAVGVPVVAYDIPGVDQLVEDGVTGLLVPHGDVGALVEACNKLLDDPELKATLTANARARVEEVYSARRMADEYLELFQQLMSSRTSTVTGGAD
ncbi:glycosyltransferase family 4 protein [Marinobacter sp. NFXS11]|uniref:glycosyltransferase family 4 protein n=1 Tax=Marinobacter sp. NFXS11 TaxID=2818432 RepID=UPI0032DEF23D